MVKIAVLANCQAAPVATLLQLASSKVEINRVAAVHTIKPDKAQALFDAVEKSDIILHQPVGEGFGPIASDALRARYPDKTYVSFPSIYFGGTLPHLAYLRLPGGGTLKGPLGDYHDTRVLHAFLASRPQEDCLAALDSPAIAVRAHFDTCVAESLRRENGTDVAVMDVILDRIRHSQTLYTFNHCDNHVLWAVAQRSLDVLGIARDGADKPPMRLMLGGVIAAVPAVVTETLEMTWRQDHYVLDGTALPNPEMIAAFYDLYSNHEGLDRILQHNRSRFALALS